MTPSNTHPRTAVRGPRRAFLLQAACGLLTALLAAPAPALAQGVIHFTQGVGIPYPLYRVNDDGTNLQQLTSFPQILNSPHVYASAQSGYPGGRQFLYTQTDGQLPNGGASYDLMAWSEGTGQSKAVTNIHGPLYVEYSSGTARWSNDGLDSFVSFLLFNFATGEYYTYRAHISATDITSPTFQPITLGDPRLELVKYWGVGAVGYDYWWNHDGSGFCYPWNSTGVMFKAVGGGDTLVFSGTVPLTEFKVSPASDAHLVATARPVGTGIVAIDLQTSTSWWLATGTGNTLGPRGPAFSPDGSQVAFGSYRTAKGKSYPGVYKVPFIGGPLTKVTELQTSGYVTVNNWNTP
jgi:hypothetical protein